MSGVVFDPARAKVDAAYRTEAMELYKQGKLDISDSDLKWLKQILGVSEDENQYEIEEEKHSNKPSSSQKANAVVDVAAPIVTAAASEIAKHVAVNAVKNTAAYLGADPLMQEAMKEKAGTNAAAPIECLAVMAIAAKYVATRPNKDEHKELMDLQEVMETGNLELINGQAQIEESNENVEDIQTDVEDEVATVEEQIAELQKQLEEKQARLEELELKLQNGEALTEEEQAEYEALGGEDGEIAQLQSEIEDLKAGIVEDTDDKQEDIEAEEETVEEVTNIFNSVEEVADYSETFDEPTQMLSVLEAAGQGLNVAQAVKALVDLRVQSPLLMVTAFGQFLKYGTMAAGAISVAGAAEQTKFAIDIGGEITVREGIQSTGVSVAEEIETTTENIAEGITATDDLINGLGEDNPPTEPPADPPADPPVETPPEPDGNGDNDDKKDPSEE